MILKQTSLMENSEPVLFAHATRHPEKIDRFFPLSHFGKKEAALDIIKYTMERKKLSDDSGFHIEDVYLCMKNPLRLPDIKEHHNILAWRDWFVPNYELNAKKLTLSERRSDKKKKEYRIAVCGFIFKDTKEMDIKDVRFELDLETLYPPEVRKQMLDLEKKEDRMPTNPKYQEMFVEQFERNLLKFQRLIRFLETEGYDGVRYQNEWENAGQDSFIIFRPEQVFSHKDEVHCDGKTSAKNEEKLKEIEISYFEKQGISTPPVLRSIPIAVKKGRAPR